MRQVPQELDINRAVNGLFLVRNPHEERPFTVMLISCSRGTRLIDIHCIACHTSKVISSSNLERNLAGLFCTTTLHTCTLAIVRQSESKKERLRKIILGIAIAVLEFGTYVSIVIVSIKFIYILKLGEKNATLF